MHTLVLGLGNPILGDDGVGLHVADAVRQHLPLEGVEVDTDCWGGLRLMERLVGYDRAIIIDAICTGNRPPGTVMRLGPNDLPTQHSASAHDITLPTALQLAQTMGLPMPQEITIIAVEAQIVDEFGEHLTPGVARAVATACDEVLSLIRCTA